MTTVALLYPGEMGSAFARVLIKAGHKIISPLDGRSDQTLNAAKAAGVETCATMIDAVTQSSIVLSLVPPKAVIQVATEVATACADADVSPLFIDMNAKSISDAQAIGTLLSATNIPFVNACVIGRASHLGEEGSIYASAPDASAIVSLFEGALPVTMLGPEIEVATAFKMTFAGFNKVVAAALFETANTANAFGITKPLFSLLNIHLGGTLKDMSKLVPNYPRHVGRRSDEMFALASTLAAQRLPNAMCLAAGATMRAIAASTSWQDERQDQEMLDLLAGLKLGPK